MQPLYSVLFSKPKLPFLLNLAVVSCYWADSVMCNFISQRSDDTWSSAGEWEKQQLEDIVLCWIILFFYTPILWNKGSQAVIFLNRSEVWLLISCFSSQFRNTSKVWCMRWNLAGIERTNNNEADVQNKIYN
jgi:hypothetical protein